MPIIKPKKTKKPFASTALGIGVNTILGLPKAAVGVGKDILRGIARSVGSAGLTVGGALGGEREMVSTDIKSPFGQELFRNVFGDKPLKSIENRIAESEIEIKNSPFAKSVGLDKRALELSFLGIMGSTALDLIPFGGLEKNAVKQLLKATTAKEASTILSKLKVPAETISIFAPKFANMKTASEVEDAFNMMRKTMPVEALKDAIKSAKPLRGDIENLQTIERAKRFALASQRQAEVGGQQGYFAGLSKLKGELVQKPPTFTPPSESLSQKSVDELFSSIQKNPTLNFGEQLTGQNGLRKLLDGHVPVPSELQVLEEVFGSDVVRAVFDKRPLGKKLWDLTGEIVADIPRALKTTLDMSATLRQGVMLGLRHPIKFSKSFGESFKSMISNNHFEKLLDEVKLQPEFRVAKDAGLAMSDPRKLFGQREEYFLSNLAEKIPIAGRLVKASNRAYVGMLNTLRYEVFNDLAKSLTVHGEASQANLKALADYINTATGRGSLGSFERSAQNLSKLFFAPRYVMSRVKWMNPNWYAKQPAPVRKEALKTMGTFVGTVSSIVALAKMGGADVETDWRSSNFGKMKVGNSYYDLTAGFGLYVRLLGQMLTGVKKTQSGKLEEYGSNKPFSEDKSDALLRAFRGKLAPAFASAWNLIDKKNIVGEPVTLKSEAVESVMPLYIGDLIDAVKDRGPEALFQVGLPAFFGVGVTTFENKTNKITPRKIEVKKIQPK